MSIDDEVTASDAWNRRILIGGAPPVEYWRTHFPATVPNVLDVCARIAAAVAELEAADKVLHDLAVADGWVPPPEDE